MPKTTAARRRPLKIGRITTPLKKDEIDTIVIGDWLFVEALDYRTVFVEIGDRRFNVYIPYDKSIPVQTNEID